MKNTPDRATFPFARNAVLANRLPPWRSKLVVFVMFLAFLALAVRAFWIQGPGSAFYRKQGERRYEHMLEIPATRGNILDRNGALLATSLPVRAIWAEPEAVPESPDPEKLELLAQWLDVPKAQLEAKLGGNKRFVYLAREVPVDVAANVIALHIPGIYEQHAYRRLYPEGDITAQVTGFTNLEDEGQDGIELGDQKNLAGVSGLRQVIRDRMGHIVEDVDDQVAPRDGQDLELSLDSRIQYIAYANLKSAVDRFHAKDGSAMVIDVRTGEILALANYPSYDPNDRSQLFGSSLRNRALTDEFEPGSIMKPLTIGLALDLGRIMPTTLVDTGSGRFVLDGATITDDGAYGVLSIGGVIQKSSNIGATKIGLMLRPEEMWNMYGSLGLGQAPRIGFPGATAGRIRPWKHWRRIEQATMSYGYGLSASLFQLARAYTAIAHNGQVLPVTIFHTPGDVAVSGLQVFSPKTAREVRTMLEAVVSPAGTSPEAAVPGYRVGGKSGTAYKDEAHGYDHSKYRASFIGMAPMPDPRIVVAVTVDEPSKGGHFGGQVAGPVFSAITGETLRSLNVPPDLPVMQTALPALPDATAMTGGSHANARTGRKMKAKSWS